MHQKQSYPHIQYCCGNNYTVVMMVSTHVLMVMISSVYNFHREDQKKQKKEELQQRRSRFIPYVIHNDTGSPLWFMTATSTPSRWAVSSTVTLCT